MDLIRDVTYPGIFFTFSLVVMTDRKSLNSP